MLVFLNNPKTQEVIGRTLLNTVKLGVVAFLFISAQQMFHQQSNETIGATAEVLSAAFSEND